MTHFRGSSTVWRHNPTPTLLHVALQGVCSHPACSRSHAARVPRRTDVAALINVLIPVSVSVIWFCDRIVMTIKGEILFVTTYIFLGKLGLYVIDRFNNFNKEFNTRF